MAIPKPILLDEFEKDDKETKTNSRNYSTFILLNLHKNCSFIGLYITKFENVVGRRRKRGNRNNKKENAEDDVSVITAVTESLEPIPVINIFISITQTCFGYHFQIIF